MEKGATVTCQSTVPIWGWPRAVNIAMEVATELNKRLDGRVSVLFRESMMEGVKPPNMLLYADLAWRNEVFVSLCCTPAKKSAVYVTDPERGTIHVHPNTHPGTDASLGYCGTTEDALSLVILCARRHYEELRQVAGVKFETAEFLLAKLA